MIQRKLIIFILSAFCLLPFSLHAAGIHDAAQCVQGCGAEALRGSLIGLHDVTFFIGVPAISVRSYVTDSSTYNMGIISASGLLSIPSIWSLVSKSATKASLVIDENKTEFSGYENRMQAEQETSAAKISYLVGRLIGIGGSTYFLHKTINKIPKEHYAYWVPATQILGSGILCFQSTPFFQQAIIRLFGDQ